MYIINFIHCFLSGPSPSYHPACASSSPGQFSPFVLTGSLTASNASLYTCQPVKLTVTPKGLAMFGDMVAAVVLENGLGLAVALEFEPGNEFELSYSPLGDAGTPVRTTPAGSNGLKPKVTAATSGEGDADKDAQNGTGNDADDSGSAGAVVGTVIGVLALIAVVAAAVWWRGNNSGLSKGDLPDLPDQEASSGGPGTDYVPQAYDNAVYDSSGTFKDEAKEDTVLPGSGENQGFDLDPDTFGQDAVNSGAVGSGRRGDAGTDVTIAAPATDSGIGDAEA